MEENNAPNTAERNDVQQNNVQQNNGEGAQEHHSIRQEEVAGAATQEPALARRRSAPPSGSESRPFTSLRRFVDDMDRMFDEWGFGRNILAPIFGRDTLGKRFEGFGRMGEHLPDIEVLHRDDALIVRADLPGISKEDLNVEIKDGALIIQGERRADQEERREGYYRSERAYGRFYRSVPLPRDVDGEDAQATFKDGVLEIRMKAPPRPELGRRISID